jgi:probable phosphomutase (TIGR03848 family)
MIACMGVAAGPRRASPPLVKWSLVTTVLLVRHGRTAANASGLLAGWTPGVALDDAGRAQAQALGRRLAPLPLAAVITSPLERCQETGAALAADRADVKVEPDERLGECKYGEWTGQEIRKLAKDPLWKVIQAHPSAVTFPGEDGEPLRDMQARAVAAVREWNSRLGDDAVWVAVSHGDVIKAVVADALGLHLDQFQRIVIDPCSVTAIRYTELRPFVLRLNDTGDDLAALRPPKPTRRRRRSAGLGSGPDTASDAVIGGGAGAGGAATSSDA